MLAGLALISLMHTPIADANYCAGDVTEGEWTLSLRSARPDCPMHGWRDDATLYGSGQDWYYFRADGDGGARFSLTPVDAPDSGQVMDLVLPLVALGCGGQQVESCPARSPIQRDIDGGGGTASSGRAPGTSTISR